jgi:hypothetical protein
MQAPRSESSSSGICQGRHPPTAEAIIDAVTGPFAAPRTLLLAATTLRAARSTPAAAPHRPGSQAATLADRLAPSAGAHP